LLGEAQQCCRVVDLGAPRLRQAWPALHRYLRREQPNALLAAMWPLTVVVALARVTAARGARLVMSDHNTLSRQYAGRGCLHRVFLRVSMAAGYRWANARVAVSSGVADDLAALSGIRRAQFEVIYNPVPMRLEGAQLAAWGGHCGARLISVGALKRQKNHALLIRAFSHLTRELDATLVILGEGDLRGELETLVKAKGLEGRVLMPGFVDNPAPWYRTADLFVLSSDYEGFGMVIVEALACGVPVISTDCPSGPAEILENGRYGRLVPIGDEHALARAIGEELGSAHDREALKHRAADFAPGVAAEAYLRLLFPEQGQSAQELVSSAA
jgi:glycosyltransferase involved in cell wall biosynthesis